MKIISGGQTGVDRAALDVALKHGIECGGWCPAGRADEFGQIPAHYPVKEMPAGSFAERTLQNVKDSDATVILYFRNLAGGSEHTLQCCIEQSKPHRTIDASEVSERDAANVIVDLARDHNVSVLNVAGPRKSEWPDGYDYAFRVLEIFLTRSAAL
ncbi:MAG: hypothetical protein QOG48_612 [Verrucomicrobiota bacterium]